MRMTPRLLLSAISLVFAITAFALTLALTVSGASPTTVPSFFILRTDTSTLGTNIIELRPASSSSSSSSNDDDDSNPFTDFISDISDLIPSSLTNSLNSEVQSTINTILTQLISTLPIPDTITTFPRFACEVADRNVSNPTTQCTTIDTQTARLQEMLREIPASATVGPTEVAVPVIEEALEGLRGVIETIRELATAVFAFLVIALVCLGLITVASIVAAVLNAKGKLGRMVVRVNLTLAVIAWWAELGAALAVTGAVVIIGLVRDLVGAVGLVVTAGSAALAVVWVNVVLVGGLIGIWSAVWFVEVRRTSWVKRRHREEALIGDWKGTQRQTWADVRGEKRQKVEKAEAHSAPANEAEGGAVS